ncbi:MAG TPA: CAP domain-containing protein [Bacillota bacterium]|jgi:uncharacterized protein YkwD|nr:CAP domain-containing protein [Fastidiosipila sp.]HPX93170.1 CAP domain-containing protein [Bacillota bacterium]HQB81674.1 CAP domain-containing protein [Bacillota bacterium]
MKKPILIAVLVLLLANLVNQTVGVAARGVAKQPSDDWGMHLAVSRRMTERKTGAGPYLNKFDLKHLEPASGSGISNELDSEKKRLTRQTSPAETKAAGGEPARPAEESTATAPTLPSRREETKKTTTTTAAKSQPAATTPKETTAVSAQPTTTTTSAPPTTTTSVQPTTTTSVQPATTEPTTTAATALKGYYCADFESEVVRLVNIEREANGAGPVTMNQSLRSSAAVRALEIVDKFSHERPDGTRWVTAIRIKYACAGENLAAGQRTPANVVNAWMNSEGHRKNLLNPKYTEIGVACYHDPDSVYKYYWTQIYAGYGN